MNFETEIMQIIVNSGQSKSLSMEAIALSKQGDFENAEKKREESQKFLSEAHKYHTALLQSGCDEDISFSMLLTHAQDHMMMAIFAGEMAGEISNLYGRISLLESKS